MEPIIDSHAHLFFPEFEGQWAEVLRRAGAAGVAAIVNVGTRPETNLAGLTQVRKFNEMSTAEGGCATPETWPRLYGTVGFHPHEADLVRAEDWPAIAEQACAAEVVGLGEFGLDYHYEHSSRAGQLRVLRGGIELALRTGKPLVIHSREAGLGVVETLDELARGAMPRGVFHCFTDPWATAEAALERGFYIGLTGILTYPNSENVREVARRVPLARLLVETDAPFCTPDPLRSERRKQRKKGHEEPNEPAFVGLVCAKIAELHGVPVDQVRRQTRENARGLFGLA